MNDELEKGNWHIVAPDKLISHETKTENNTTFVKLIYADGTIMETIINSDKGTVDMKINKKYIVNSNGTIEIVK